METDEEEGHLTQHSVPPDHIERSSDHHLGIRDMVDGGQTRDQPSYPRVPQDGQTDNGPSKIDLDHTALIRSRASASGPIPRHDLTKIQHTYATLKRQPPVQITNCVTHEFPRTVSQERGRTTQDSKRGHESKVPRRPGGKHNRWR